MPPQVLERFNFHSVPSARDRRQQPTINLNTAVKRFLIMNKSSPLIAELETAVTSGSSEKRIETLRRVTDLFLNQADRLNDQQVAVFDDVLMHLVQRIETRTLAELSCRLAAVDNSPIHTIKRLAYDDDVAVAGPVLAQSKRIGDEDLLAVARHKSQEHLLAISNRVSLSTAVTDVLVERGNDRVVHSLAGNSGARFSETGFTTLVKKAAGDDALTESLGLRLDVPAALLKQLLLRATELVRSRLLASAQQEKRADIQNILAIITTQVESEAAAVRDFTQSDNLVRELNRNGKLNEAALRNFAAGCQYEEMTSSLALFCQTKVEIIEALMKNLDCEGLLVACRAANLNWPTVAAILMARFPHHRPSAAEVDLANVAYQGLSVAAAQRTLRFMAVKRTVHA
jgi:uncharacterized protein (DUF2336 family)